MAEVLKLGITAKNNQAIKEVSSIEVLANKGIVGDRHFQEFSWKLNEANMARSSRVLIVWQKLGVLKSSEQTACCTGNFEKFTSYCVCTGNFEVWKPYTTC